MPPEPSDELTRAVPHERLQQLADALTALAGVPMYFATPDGRLITRVEAAEKACAAFTHASGIQRPCASCARRRLASAGPWADDDDERHVCPLGLHDLVLPVRLDDRVVAVLGTVQFGDSRAAGEEARRRAVGLGAPLAPGIDTVPPDRADIVRQAAAAVVGVVVELAKKTIESERARAEAEWLARTDALTGLGNRRQAFETLRDLHALAARHGRRFAVMIGDIDHFKRVNDTLGHDVGDRALVGVAHALRDGLRSTDHVFRTGGEEFLVVCPETGLSGARAVAERLRQRVADAAITLGSLPPVTISIGVAASPPREPPGIDALLKLADHALYLAKSAGRDRVVVVRCPRAARSAETPLPSLSQ